MATMKDKKEKGYALGRSKEAIVCRAKQLKQWENSETNHEQDSIKTTRRKPRVKFSDGVIFLAATAAGDTNEVEHMILEDGIDVNYKNLDGMTALHQCCIDDNLDMAMILVKNTANIDAQDKEGWAPLHAASSCGHAHIVQYLLDNGAYPAPVNSDGDTPLDIAEDEEIQELLQAAIDSYGIDVDNQKHWEESLLMADALKLKSNPSSKPVISAGGATPLHIACAKGYDKVIEVLLSCDNVQVDVIDDDGWTPLHAAVYWGHMDAAEQLVEHGANVNATTNNIDAIDDLVDPELVEKLDELKILAESCQKDQKIVSTYHIRNSSFSGILDMSKHNSPSLKRRPSKDKAEHPKLLDMLREKKELQMMREHEQEEPSMSPPLEASVAKEQSPATTTMTATQPHREQLVDPQLQHNIDQHPEEETSHDNEHKHQQCLQTTQSLPPEASRNQDDRKIERDKRPSSVSERRKLFEPSFGSIGIQDKKLAIQRREKTPGHPGMAQDKNSNNSAQLQSTPLSHKLSDSNLPKRFAFVPKHVSTYDDMKMPTESEVKPIVAKRSSSDGHTKSNNSRPLSFSNTVSEIQEALPSVSSKMSTDYHEHDKLETNMLLGSMVTTSPKKQQRTALSYDSQESTHLQAMVNHDEHLHDVVTPSEAGGSDRLSSSVVSSNSDVTSSAFTTPDSSMLSERNTSFTRLHSDDAEAKRRVTAKKKREARRVTQPVDNNVLKQISREDAELEQREDELQIEAEELAEKLKPLKSSEVGVEDSTLAADLVNDQLTSSVLEQPTGRAEESTIKPVQSRFKPAARPPPRVMVDSLPKQQTLWGRPADGQIAADMMNLSASLPASTAASLFSVPHPPSSRQDSNISEATTPGTPGEFSRARAQSDVRRRPKTTRRSTGITFEDDSEKGEGEKQNVSEELSKILASTTATGGRKLPQTPDQQLDDTSRLESASVPPPPPLLKTIEAENAELRRLLAEECTKKEKIYEDYYHVAVRIDELKKTTAELTRRSEDTSRAYEQEKTEKEKLQIRLKELEDMLKCFQDISSENQRLKDENGALIRVIGKLSRPPLQHQ